MRYFDNVRIQQLILKFPDPDKFVQDTEWRALRSDNLTVFNSQHALRLAMLHDVMVATMYEKYSGLKIVFNYGVFMMCINDVERHYNLVSQELTWLTQTFCTKGTNWEIRIADTPDAWRNLLAIMLGGTLEHPHFKTKKQIQSCSSPRDGNLYDPDHPLYQA